MGGGYGQSAGYQSRGYQPPGGGYPPPAGGGYPPQGGYPSQQGYNQPPQGPPPGIDPVLWGWFQVRPLLNQQRVNMFYLQ